MNSNVNLAAQNSGSAVSSLFSGMAQSEALRTQGEIADSSGRLNATFAEMQAEDALKRGDIAVNRSNTNARKVLGSQRARLAAQGISVDSGSALDTQVETGRLSHEDAITIRSNAFREALGFKSQSENYRFASKIAKMSGDFNADQTLLTAGTKALEYGGKAADNIYDLGKDKKWWGK